MQYDASSVPIVQLALSSDRFSASQLYDLALYTVRQQLIPVLQQALARLGVTLLIAGDECIKSLMR